MGNTSLPRDVFPYHTGIGPGSVRLRLNGGSESLASSSWSIYVNEQIVFTGSIDKCRDWLDLYEFKASANPKESSTASASSRSEKECFVSRIACWFSRRFRKH